VRFEPAAIIGRGEHDEAAGAQHADAFEQRGFEVGDVLDHRPARDQVEDAGLAVQCRRVAHARGAAIRFGQAVGVDLQLRDAHALVIDVNADGGVPALQGAI
jgi:hypothetical protein